MFNVIRTMIGKCAFSDSLFGVFFNPFFLTRRELYKNICDLGRNLDGCVLDVGCGSKPYKEKIHYKEYSGLEYDTPENRSSKKADYFYDGLHFPFKDASFDCVLSTEVLEHVFEPQIFISEIHRILKPGGKMLITVPFIWDEHEPPYDYGRYSSFGINYLLTQHGFKIIEQRKTCADTTIFFQLWNDYLYKKIIGNGNLSRFLIINLFTSFSNLFGLISSYILPSNKDLYLDNILLVEKTAREDHK